MRSAGVAEIAGASSIRLSLEDDPALVPLETLPGRDHYRFPPNEEPPWRWSIASRPTGRPSVRAAMRDSRSDEDSRFGQRPGTVSFRVSAFTLSRPSSIVSFTAIRFPARLWPIGKARVRLPGA